MALMQIRGAAIAGIAGCVPPRIMDNMTQTVLTRELTDAARREYIQATGIREVRYAEPNVCASDLACQAGEKLLTDMAVDRTTIRSVIFLSQGTDYFGVPPTACILQNRLKLSTDCVAFDMLQCCGGFIVALHTAFSHAAQGMRVLLLIGETGSRCMSPHENMGGLMFGDGAVALLIDPQPEAVSHFSLNTDGSGFDAIIIEGGGYRNMASEETLRYRVDVDGVLRTMHQMRLDKMRVLDFTRERAAPDIKKLAQFAGVSLESIDKLFLHQANLFIIESIVKRLKVAPEKVPVTIDRFGNTSTLSIPLGMVATLGDDARKDRGQILMCGFGGGLSWGTVSLDLKNCYLGSLINYTPEGT